MIFVRSWLRFDGAIFHSVVGIECVSGLANRTLRCWLVRADESPPTLGTGALINAGNAPLVTSPCTLGMDVP